MKVVCCYSSIDDSVPALPPKREKRPVSSSGSIISNRSQNTASPNSLLFSSPQEQDNDERIQLIVDDINHIIENYTRELDDALQKKTTIRSPSIDYISQQNHSAIASCRYNSIDTLYGTHLSKHSFKDNFTTQQHTLINNKEDRKTTDQPPLPLKRQTGNLIY
jgi:hypothetical protein